MIRSLSARFEEIARGNEIATREESRAGKYVTFAVFASLLASIGLVIGSALAPNVPVIYQLLLVSSTLFVLFVSGRVWSQQNFTSAALLHPLVGPFLFLTYFLLAPLWYIAVTGQNLQFVPAHSLNAPTTLALCATVILYGCGAVFGLRRATPTLPIADSPGRRIEGSRKVRISILIGRVILVAALLAKVYQWVIEGPVFARTYGANQMDYSINTSIAVAGGALVAVGCLLVMFGNTVDKGRPLLAFDWALVISLALISVFILGLRSEVIAPVIIYLWFRLRNGRIVRLRWIFAGVVAAAAAFLAIAQYRTKGTGSVPGSSLVESLIVETSSPVLLTSNVIRLVPSDHSFYFGSTYLEALKFMLPGPVSRALFGEPDGTGSAAYRDLINYTNEGQGWGFALPTEAYLNFGFVGIVVVALALGWIFGRAFSIGNGAVNAGRLRGYIYPLLISYLAFGIRSDALGQLKSTIYPLLIIAVVLFVSEQLAKRSPLLAPDRGSRRESLTEERPE